MTPFDKLLDYLIKTWQIDLFWLAKGGVLLFIFLYFLFTLVVLRQVKTMSETITGVLEKELTLAAKLLMGLAIVVFLIALIIL
ncbi:MAG: DUF5657 family protein [Candidatus Beckwithbacteria bacterium]|nr:hypothetical protein [Patescibacteria group bacterium]